MDPNVFEINPLDLGIAEIQFKLKSRIEAIKDTSDFDLISEKFISKSPCMIPFTIDVRCFMDTSVGNGLVIQIHLYDKEGKGIMVEGKTESKEDLLQEIECRDFFFSCKKLVLEFLKRAEKKNLVVFTGAGVSAESGLLTFRGLGGWWKRYNYKKCSSLKGYEENPKAVLDFYNARRKELTRVSSNQAHKLLAKLEEKYNVTIITQNVDDLHERAGSSHVIHLHGELSKVTSSKDMWNPNYIKQYPLDVPIALGDKAEDGSQLRPFIVLFGEQVLGIEVAMDYVKEADIFVVIGTSLAVHPAANLLECAKADIPRFVIDPNKLKDERLDGFTYIKASATDGIGKLFNELMD